MAIIISIAEIVSELSYYPNRKVAIWLYVGLELLLLICLPFLFQACSSLDTWCWFSFFYKSLRLFLISSTTLLFLSPSSSSFELSISPIYMKTNIFVVSHEGCRIIVVRLIRLSLLCFADHSRHVELLLVVQSKHCMSMLILNLAWANLGSNQLRLTILSVQLMLLYYNNLKKVNGLTPSYTIS